MVAWLHDCTWVHEVGSSGILIHMHGVQTHNIIKQCAFAHVGLDNVTMGCPT